jgi:hypothetical protein
MCLSRARTWIFNNLCRVFFYVQWVQFREVIFSFVDIGVSDCQQKPAQMRFQLLSFWRYFSHCCFRNSSPQIYKLIIDILLETLDDFNWNFTVLGLGCLTPLSTIFQLCHGSQFMIIPIKLCEFESHSWPGVLDTTLCDQVHQWLAASSVVFSRYSGFLHQ